MPTQELARTDPVRVGPYRLRGRLGSGGMGVVYLADGHDGGPVAVKCLPPGVGGEIRVRLQREAEYLSAVRHPRVASFVAADVHADRPWIAMDYIAGPSLAQAAVPLGPAQLRHLAEGLADALRALHRQGLTHRDVKPGNIILTHDGPVLVDLGIASGGDLTSMTQAGMIVGTPEWMAPEQLTGYPARPATDVWGWACVVVFAATGRTPFGSGPIEALAHRIRYEAPDLHGVPDWLRGAVSVALTKDDRGRPAAAALATVAGIRAVSTAAGTLAAEPPPRRRAQPMPPLAPAASPPPPRPFLPPRASVPRSVLPASANAPAHPVPRTPPPVVPTRSRTHRPMPEADRPLPHGSSAAKRAQARRAKSERARAKELSKRRPAPPQRRRRSPVRRLIRSTMLLLLVLVLAVAAGIGGYLCVWHGVHGGSWGEALRRLAHHVRSG